MNRLETYFDRIMTGIEELSGRMETITRAADETAERITHGGIIYGLSDEEGFISELSSRSGGMFITQGIKEDTVVESGDVILAATQDRKIDEQKAAMEEYMAKGALVILIGSGETDLRRTCGIFIETGLPKGTAPVISYSDEMICPAAGVLHLTALWMFCSELTMACIRRGKVPVFYQSGALKAGSLRNSVHKGMYFHPDGEFAIQAVPAGEIGNAYLSELRRCMNGIRATEFGKFKEAGKHAAETIQAGGTVWCDSIGHHLPSQAGITGDPGIFTLGFPERKDVSGPFESSDTYMFNGYYIVPEEKLAEVRETSIPSVWIMGGKEVESVYPHAGEIHINTYWTYGDAGLRIPGYDIKILPVSGIIATAALWMLHAAAADALAPA